MAKSSNTSMYNHDEKQDSYFNILMKMKDKYRADSFTSDKGVTQPSGTWQIKCKKQH